MKERFLSVYVNLQDENLIFPSYLDNQYFIISICPNSIMCENLPHNDKTPVIKLAEKGINEIKKSLEKGCLLGQRGYIGRCRYPHKHNTDPWHENYCLYGSKISLEEQIKFMEKGKKILKDAFGVEPSVYASINHLWDSNTLLAVKELDYSYMMDQNNLGIEPYKKDRIIILPESKIRSIETPRSSGIYVHADMLGIDEISDILEKIEFTSPSKIKVTELPPNKFLLGINHFIKYAKKVTRDVKNKL